VWQIIPTPPPLGHQSTIITRALYFPAGAFAVAWVLAKPTEPIRLGVTIFLTPKIARRFGFAPALVSTMSQTAARAAAK